MKTLLSTIASARNANFSKLSTGEISEKLKPEINKSSNSLLSRGESLTAEKFDRFTNSAIVIAELFIEFHLDRMEIKDAAEFAKDVLELRTELAQ